MSIETLQQLKDRAQGLEENNTRLRERATSLREGQAALEEENQSLTQQIAELEAQLAARQVILCSGKPRLAVILTSGGRREGSRAESSDPKKHSYL